MRHSFFTNLLVHLVLGKIYQMESKLTGTGKEEVYVGKPQLQLLLDTPIDDHSNRNEIVAQKNSVSVDWSNKVSALRNHDMRRSHVMSSHNRTSAFKNTMVSNFVEMKNEDIEIDEAPLHILKQEQVQCPFPEDPFMASIKREPEDCDVKEERNADGAVLEMPLFVRVKEEPNPELILSTEEYLKSNDKTREYFEQSTQYHKEEDNEIVAPGNIPTPVFFHYNAGQSISKSVEEESYKRALKGEHCGSFNRYNTIPTAMCMEPLVCPSSAADEIIRRQMNNEHILEESEGELKEREIKEENQDLGVDKCNIQEYERSYRKEKQENLIKKTTWTQQEKLPKKEAFFCDICGLGFRFKAKFEEHRPAHIDEKPYKCNQCDKAFSHRHHVKNHMRIHSGERPYKCSQCGKSFAERGSLTAHIRIHSGEKPYICSQCDKSFTRSDTLSVHMRIHSGQKTFHCSYCEKAFFLKCNYITHSRIHSGEKPFKCSQCDKAFCQRSQIVTHMRIHTGEKPYKCSQCGKSFAESGSLSAHIRIHSGEMPYICSQCDKSFTQRHSLRSHMRIHSGEKPYKCTHCGKSFAHSSTLTTHMRIHSGERPFICNQCDKTFSHRHSHSLHMRTHSGEKPYKCTHCGKSFAHSSTLTVHMRIHSGEKPYKCSQCDKSFAEHGSLTAHMRIHSGEKPYKCSQCDKAFTHRRSIRFHVQTHSSERQYKCDHCDKSFAHIITLTAHMLSHSGE